MNKLTIWIYLGVLCVFLGCKPRQIIERPITFDETRTKLTLEYLKEHYNLDQETPIIEPKMVVVHYTVIPTYEKTFDVFDPPELPGHREAIKNASSLNVSSHYVVDRDGTIYRLMSDTIMARHVIGLNHCAIGIENVADGGDLPLTRAQLRANQQIIEEACAQYDIQYVIGHHEYQLFEGHELWLEQDQGYRTKKSDPGDEFMMKLRKKIKGLDLKELPEKK